MAYLCFKCYENLGYDSKLWDYTTCDDTIANQCDRCEMKGVYIRKIEEETKI